MESKIKPGVLQIAGAFLAVYLIWGSTYLAIRFAIDTIPPLMMVGARFVLAGIPLYGILRLMGAPRPTLSEWRVAGLLGVLLLSVGTGGIAISEKSVPSGLVSLLVALVPVYVAVLEWMFSGFKKLNKYSVIGLGVSTIGIFILVGPTMFSNLGNGLDNLFGIAVVLISSLSWALGTVISRKLERPRSSMLGAAMQMMTGGVFLLVAAFVMGEHNGLVLSKISSQSLIAFAYLTVFGSIAGYSAYTWLLKHLSPDKVSTYAYVNPVVAVLLGWIILGEPVGPMTVAAACTILSGVGLISLGATNTTLATATGSYRRVVRKTSQLLKLR